MSYSSTVIPIIIAVIVMSKLEKGWNRFIYQSVQNFVTPFLSLVIMVPLTLIVFGTIGVHVEITVQLYGEFFTSPIQQGDQVNISRV